MNKKILVAVFASLSVVAVAQSQSTEKKEAPKAAEVKSPRDAATGQASGRRMEGQTATSTDSSVKGGTDVNADRTASKTGYNVKSQNSARVAAGDVNGDGAANAATGSDVKSPRDAASGMPTGKRQHQPIRITKESDQGAQK